LSALSFGLIAFSINLILVRGFNAFEDTKTQVVSIFIINLIAVALSYVILDTVENEYVTILAEYVKAYTRPDGYDAEHELEIDYDEFSDTYYWKEGWYEKIETWPEYSYIQIEDEQILYWQDLPTSPQDNDS
jgi:hypothetical protein